jgi:hypothetical protein
VLIIGCGQLGSRHLQAVATLPHVGHIAVVDRRPEALLLGRERLCEVHDRNEQMAIRWLSSWEEATSGGDLCIVATQAEGRCKLVQTLAQQLGYRLFLIEKLVGQSVQEVEGLWAMASDFGWSVWVNCKTRAYPIHQAIKQRLDPSEPILMSVVGGNHGLANNGIHAADLFAFYDGTEEIHPLGSCVDPVVHRTKRNSYDLSGTLLGGTRKGSRFVLSYAGHHDQQELTMIATSRARWLVDHFQRSAFESTQAEGWAWRLLPLTDNMLVSHMTKTFAADLLTTGRCALPTLEESLVAHRFILGELQPHFTRLLESTLTSCPVS